MAFPGGGANPQYGRDMGPPPPSVGQGFAPGGQPPAQGPWGYYPNQMPLNYQSYTPTGSISGAYGYSPSPMMGQQPFGARLPQPYPNVDPTMPASHMTNTTGGVGCEPGYNYFFPPEHTKVHVLKTGSTAPWRLPRNFTMQFHAAHVPSNITLREILKGFGACNPIPKKNKVTEVVQGGGGQWYSGMSFSGDDEVAMSKKIRDLGWDSTRTGLPGQKPVVFLYIQKG